MSCNQDPITIENFVLALASMSQSAIYAELNRLNNAMAHLSRSNDEINDYIEQEQDTEDLESLVELKSTINENEVVISNQRARIAVIRSVLADRALHSHIDDPIVPLSSSSSSSSSSTPPSTSVSLAEQPPAATELAQPETTGQASTSAPAVDRTDVETNGIYL